MVRIERDLLRVCDIAGIVSSSAYEEAVATATCVTNEGTATACAVVGEYVATAAAVAKLIM